jgi:hypothetical protein
MPAKKDSARLWTEKRMCGDYRPLNLVTPQDRYPMPIPEELFDSIGDSNIFTIVATLLWPSVGVKPNTWKK